MRRGLIPIAVLFLAAVAGAAVWLLWFAWIPVQVVAARTGPAVRAVYATGTVEPVLSVKISPTVGGRLVSMVAEERQSVQAGAVLAQLDDRESMARVAELKAKLAFQAEQLHRLQALRQSGTASRQAFEQAQSDHGQTAAALEQAARRLADLTIRSPIDGVVLQKEGEVGEVVREGQVLYWIGQPGQLRVSGEVDEEDITLVEVGQKALMKADAFPGKILDGTVSEITPRGDPVNRSYRVRIALPADTPLHVGMTVEINVIAAERPKAVLVPLAAVRDGEVWTVLDGRARRQKVDVGVIGDTQIEIRSGISAGEQVVVDPPKRLKDGARVRARIAAGF